MTNKIYQENKINGSIATCYNYLNKIQGLNYYLEQCEFGEEEFVHKEIEQEINHFNNLLKKTYLIILAYIESQQNFEILNLYKKDLEIILENNFNAITTTYIDEIEETLWISKELDKMKDYLIPYQSFNDDLNKNSGLLYLENILTSTGVLLNKLGIIPTSETQVYKPIKFILNNIFLDSSFPSEPFHRTAKCYIPDILIPSLNVAIEYKYATDENKLINTIEQILIDVVGYSNHPIYKIFYAVFYVKPGVCGEKRFTTIWNGFNFPKNWKPLLVLGE